MYTVFVTGGIGSGKSTVCDIMGRHPSTDVIDLDIVARGVLDLPEVKRELADAFGGDVLRWGGIEALQLHEGDYRGLPDYLVEPYDQFYDYSLADVDRVLLACRAFENPDATALLNAITHPRISDALSERICGGACACMGSAPRLLVVEVPLIDKVGDVVDLADEIVAVSVPVDVRRERAVKRGMSPKDFDARNAAQIDEADRDGIANTVIINRGSIADLEREVASWFEQRELEGWKPLRGRTQYYRPA